VVDAICGALVGGPALQQLELVAARKPALAAAQVGFCRAFSVEVKPRRKIGEALSLYLCLKEYFQGHP
jgi:hypothetical protein